MLNGWIGAKSDPYDQRYYREWMHELPPMSHVRRGTVLDVHHNILPLTARNAPDPAAIIARSQPLPGSPALRTPCPEDLLVHCLTHLMHEGELHNGLRDLHDADQMLRSFAPVAGFWERLQAVAAGNDLAGPVALGVAARRAPLRHAPAGHACGRTSKPRCGLPGPGAGGCPPTRRRRWRRQRHRRPARGLGATAHLCALACAAHARGPAGPPPRAQGLDAQA